jgi:hypothetical protein
MAFDRSTKSANRFAVFAKHDHEMTILQGRFALIENVPQLSANQALHARYAQHAHAFSLSRFVSIENKERLSYFPKLVIRVRFPSPAPNFPQ